MFLLDLTGAVNTTSDKAVAMENTATAIVAFLVFGFLAFIFIAAIVAIKKNRNNSPKNVENLSKEEKPTYEGELVEEYSVVLNKNGQTVKKEFTKEQMEMITKMLDAIPEKPKDI